MNSESNGILDDPEAVSRIDQSGMLKAIENLPEQVKDAIEIGSPGFEQFSPDAVAVLGMGGSAICGDIISSWLRSRVSVPIMTIRDYDLPATINSDSLVIAVSFSGNTEETLSAFEDAVNRKAKVIAISTGGRLKERAEAEGVPHLTIAPIEDLAPRAAIAFLLFPTISVLTRCGLLQAADIKTELDDVVETLEKLRSELHPGVEVNNNMAKQIALKLRSRSPIIYGSGPFSPIAYRWVTQLNENSKVMASSRNLPEMNHNDIVGLKGDDKTGDCSIILLRDPETESARMKKRIELTKDLAFAGAAELIEIHAEGNSILGKMLGLMYIGDYTSVYLALLRGVDPTPVEVIEKLKDQMRG